MDPLFPVLTLSERHARATKNMPLRIGLPLPKNWCFNHQKLALVTEQGQEIPACISVASLWPDNSIQWCLINSQVNLHANETLKLGLSQRLPSRHPDRSWSSTPIGATSPQSTLIQDEGTQLRVRGAARTVVIDTQRLRLFDLTDSNISGQVKLCCPDTPVDGHVEGVVETYNYRTLLTSQGALRVEVNLRGVFELVEGGRLDFLCTLIIAANGDHVNGSLTLHNAAAARHPGGLWDLGDANSLYFDSLTLGLNWDAVPEKMQGQLKISPTQPSLPFTGSAVLTQLASGGEQWDSPTHVNARGRVNLAAPGYIACIDGEELRGKRADPFAQIVRSETSISVRLEDFWERFPSELAINREGVTAGLLPNTGEAHELQPGERCTHRFAFDFTNRDASEMVEDTTPFPEPRISLDGGHVQTCALPELNDPVHIDSRVQAIIDQGLDGDRNFFSKREAIDEYGWRNFGDLWADHETEGYQGKRPFVSHYNNQYDPLFGFLKQYLNSGDTRWFSLAKDLARHTVDIDIYHTDDDRLEYNHGLFWHTDHYLPAETSSHRSYSRRQTKDAYEGHAGGGGPGGQHCYTTGLLYHYLLTGDEASRESLYGLKNWITCVYEGAGTLTDVALAVKNRQRQDLKNRLTGEYPLDRGIANYLNALMDCYVLDHSPKTLIQIAEIVQRTIHPADDIGQRKLEEVEEHWFYVVLLQALNRFLVLKADIGQIDHDFLYARDSLLHYAAWMVDHEAPYLERPDVLEFPNQTWTAQDLRKANVLFWAAHWSPCDGAAYNKKAHHLVDYIADTLCNEPSRQYTRILALLMQNASPSCALPQRATELPRIGSYAPPRTVGAVAQSVNFARLIFRALRNFSPTREIATVRRLLPTRGIKDDAS